MFSFGMFGFFFEFVDFLELGDDVFRFEVFVIFGIGR